MTNTVTAKIKKLNNISSFWEDCRIILAEYVQQFGGYEDCDFNKWQITAERRFVEIGGKL